MANFVPVMMTKTEAIVLRTVKYGDSKMVVDMFTRECGRLQFLAAVAATGRGRLKKQYFQPLAQLTVVSDVRPRLQLQRIKENYEKGQQPREAGGDKGGLPAYRQGVYKGAAAL